MEIRITTETLDRIGPEGVVLGFFGDERPPRGRGGFLDWRMNGVLSARMAAGLISGNERENVLVATRGRIGADKALLLGMGDSSAMTYDRLYGAGYCLGEIVAGVGWSDFAVEIPGEGRLPLEMAVMTEAFITGLFDFGAAEKKPLALLVVCREANVEGVRAGLERAGKTVGSNLSIRILKDTDTT